MLCVLVGRMLKRKAECSLRAIPHTEESNPEGGLPSDLAIPKTRPPVTNPAEVAKPEGVASGHVSPPPANVVEEGGKVANAFWSLLAAAGYQTW